MNQQQNESEQQEMNWRIQFAAEYSESRRAQEMAAMDRKADAIRQRDPELFARLFPRSVQKPIGEMVDERERAPVRAGVVQTQGADRTGSDDEADLYI